jgi:hypothetical protein
MRIFRDERRPVERLEAKVDRLESKMDNGFAESRADFRTLLGVLLGMFMTMILGFAGIVVGILVQLN